MLDDVLEYVVGQIDARQGGSWVKLHHVIDVVAQNGRLHVANADHVVRHEQELLVLDPLVFGADLRQFGDRAHGGDVLEQQMEHGHEMRLAGTEAAVQVARVAVGGIHRRLDETQSVVEAGCQLGRDDVLFERLLRLRHAFAQVEYEVPLGDALRHDDEVTDELFHCCPASWGKPVVQAQAGDVLVIRRVVCHQGEVVDQGS